MKSEEPHLIDAPSAWNDGIMDVDLAINRKDWSFSVEKLNHDGQMWTEASHEGLLADKIVESAPGRTYQNDVRYTCTSARLERTTSIEDPTSMMLEFIKAIREWVPVSWLSLCISTGIR